MKLAGILLGGAAFLSLALYLLWPHEAPGRVVLLITGTRAAGTNILLVSVTVSNGASRELNVVEGDHGDPAFFLDVGLKYGLNLGRGIVNHWKINLAPGTTLNDIVWITNPPPRFRLKVPIRDLAAESRRSRKYWFVPSIVADKLVHWHLMKFNVDPASSAWIEPKLP